MGALSRRLVVDAAAFFKVPEIVRVDGLPTFSVFLWIRFGGHGVGEVGIKSDDTSVETEVASILSLTSPKGLITATCNQAFFPPRSGDALMGPGIPWAKYLT